MKWRYYYMSSIEESLLQKKDIDSDVSVAASDVSGETVADDENSSSETTGCTAIGYQEVGVCVPVIVRPYGEAGEPKITCQSAAVVTSGDTGCKGYDSTECKFTVSQNLRIEVPVVFGAKTEVGITAVKCNTEDTQSTGDCNCV
jgi:hypothetical protein